MKRSVSKPPQTEGGEDEEEGGREEETYEEGREVEEEEEPCEETPEEEEVKVEWPTGVPQASDKDLAKLSHTEGVGTRRPPAFIVMTVIRGAAALIKR